MVFRWEQQRGKIGQGEHWLLIHRESGKIVMELYLSKYGNTAQNWYIRNKIKKAFTIYYNRVWFNNFTF
jgi:hypothetical protein